MSVAHLPVIAVHVRGNDVRGPVDFSRAGA
jgi:hypothetical protein